MRIAFIDHSYHHQTRSSRFFIDLLSQQGSVEVFLDDSWQGLRSPWIDSFDAEAYDCIVIWQMQSAFQYILHEHPNIVFVPMLDDLMGGGQIHWQETFNRAKILNFSMKLHRVVSKHTSSSRYLQYFPDPTVFSAIDASGPLRGFFWNRLPEINESVIATLCEGANFDCFTVHDVPDPFSGSTVMPQPVQSRIHARTVWHARRQDYLDNVARHNLFFASRRLEGIGMSVIEAMAMGLCVAAPDTSTHNEYISDGKTGLLYDLDDPRPLSFSNVAELGKRARESVEKGFMRWTSAQDALLDFVACPTEHLHARVLS